MLAARIPENENERLEKLREYCVLDTEQEQSFDCITRIIARMIGVPISLVSLVDQDRQWFKARYGLDVNETPREAAFCAHAILGDDVFVVNDALEDERFWDNPLVVDEPSVRFYASAPLITPDGYKIGTLCAIDNQPKEITDEHKLLLTELASLVIDELELGKAKKEALEKNLILESRIFDSLDTQSRLEEQGAQLVALAENEAELIKKLDLEIAVKNRFFSIIAHDLKSPFNALLGFSNLITRMPDKLTKEQFVEYATMINVSSNNLFNLLENLLEWGRFQMEKNKVEPEPLNLVDISQENIDLLNATAEEKNIELRNETPRVTVKVDRNMLLFVIRNLISNAIKFTPKGGYVKISGRQIDDMIEISVSDTGAGIQPEIAEVIFDIDRKTTTLGTEGEEGTGLGLPLCKEMVELNGGHIWVDGSAGQGATFLFTLPKAD